MQAGRTPKSKVLEEVIQPVLVAPVVSMPMNLPMAYAPSSSQLLTAIVMACLVIPIVFTSLNIKDSNNVTIIRQRNIANIALLGVALFFFVGLWWNTQYFVELFSSWGNLLSGVADKVASPPLDSIR